MREDEVVILPREGEKRGSAGAKLATSVFLSSHAGKEIRDKAPRPPGRPLQRGDVMMCVVVLNLSITAFIKTSQSKIATPLVDIAQPSWRILMRALPAAGPSSRLSHGT